MKFFRYDIEGGAFYFDRPAEGKYTEISDELWESLLKGQAQGKQIRSTENGDPYLWEYTPSKEDIETSVKYQRDRLLSESDWIGLKDVKLSKEKYAAWSAYRQALRDITEQEGYPFNVQFPQKPE
jgi:hypothetical protein